MTYAHPDLVGVLAAGVVWVGALFLLGWAIVRARHRNHDVGSSCACARQGRHGHRRHG